MARWKGVFHKQGIVGLDLGSYMIKAVQVEPTRTGWRLLQIAQSPTPADSIRDGVIVQPQAVAEAIKKLLRENAFRASAAITAIAGAPVIVRQVALPKMSEAMLRKTIRYEASKYVSTSIEDSYIGFEILGDLERTPAEGEQSESAEKQMQVLLVVAPREMVDAQIRTLEMAGLEALAIEVEAFALYRALFEINRVATAKLEGRPAAIVDIGASYTNLYIVSGDGFFLTRTIPIAGDAFTQTTQNTLHCNWSEAERFKRTVDFRHLLKRRSTRSRTSGEDDSTQESADGAQEEAVLRALQAQVDELLREVRRSLHYYQSQFPEGSPHGQVTNLVITGGSSQLGGFTEYASARLGLEVEPGDPFNNPDFDTAHISAEALQMFTPVLGIAVGLAVREAFAEQQRQAA
ncbi:MAG: type IV pilus assembly protein PilM [Armatimonadota bacterium]|nr:type IV pilus assembly protein PilM [bacterium]MDW8321043.1 type IV pilus assembly protein PilM [Armatimonadota bacterium]